MFRFVIFKGDYRDFFGSPVVKTLPSSEGGVGLIPDPGGKIPHASWPKNQNIKQKPYCKKFNKDFKKNTPHLSIHIYTYTGEGNGTPLQYSCLENPMDGGAWWATVHGVAESRT